MVVEQPDGAMATASADAALAEYTVPTWMVSRGVLSGVAALLPLRLFRGVDNGDASLRVPRGVPNGEDTVRTFVVDVEFRGVRNPEFTGSFGVIERYVESRDGA